LSDAAQSAIASARQSPLVSAVSAFEISMKYALGKLGEMRPLAEDFDRCALSNGFEVVPLSSMEASAAGRLPLHHKDPFDRLLIAQALHGDYALISNEKLFDAYGVNRLW
jgi:PIN domain nuclease of toxin-antitoxin system